MATRFFNFALSLALLYNSLEVTTARLTYRQEEAPHVAQPHKNAVYDDGDVQILHRPTQSPQEARAEAEYVIKKLISRLESPQGNAAPFSVLTQELASKLEEPNRNALHFSQPRRSSQNAKAEAEFVIQEMISNLEQTDRTAAPEGTRVVDDVILELASKLEDMQVEKDVPFRYFPLRWQQDKGLFPSEVKLNVIGSPEMAMIRDVPSCYDNNMFATSWISICLLEAFQFSGAPKPSESQFLAALDAIAQYHDKNRNYNNSVMNFWPQAYNESMQYWQSTPSNLLSAFKAFDFLPMKTLEEILKLLGFSDVEHIIESILELRSIYESAFHIPPDFDDSFVNLGLGALLKDLKSDLPAAFNRWSDQNPNVTSVLDAVRHYAYRPFSQDENVNTIDVRTYYYIRHFLGEAASRKEDVALVPTWAQNIDEVRTAYFKGVAMPFSINNVDVTVAANALYGMTAAILSGVLPEATLDDPVIKQVYVNTSAMIAYQIRHQLFGRPDLQLAYYPSVTEFYWFVARTLARLESAQLSAPLPPAMQAVYSSLKPVLEQNMTKFVTQKAKAMGDDMVYFDDFLGDGDVDSQNHTLVRGEDRLFTTSVTVNALLTTWTLFDEVKRTTRWKPNTPPTVRSTVEKSTKFLRAYILKDDYKPWNAFFSGSIKGQSTTPFGFPSNRIEYLNGTAIPSDKHFPSGGPFLFGVKGFIPEAKYSSLLKEPHFGVHTPTTFTTYNQPNTYFPFWTSTAYTYANTLLSLSRFDSIQP